MYSFYCWWASGLFPALDCFRTVAVNILHLSLGGVHAFLQSVYTQLALWDHAVSMLISCRYCQFLKLTVPICTTPAMRVSPVLHILGLWNIIRICTIIRHSGVCTEIPHGRIWLFLMTDEVEHLFTWLFAIWTFSFAKYQFSCPFYDELCVFFFF